MQFTIEKDLTIKGTRGETGNIHITFDRDMTGTKGVFLVKRSFDTSDNDAFLIKNFIFGTNPAISGREIIISLTREDTEHMPILLPDSPYVFASDYKDIECSNYVWAIKLGSSCYTDTVIPRPGTTYPTFRLYNEAYFDKEGTPVVPHPPFPSPDIYATKKDLIHYAAAQKQLTDQLSGGIYELSGSVRLGFLNMAERHLSDIDGLDQRIDKLESESHDIPGIIVTLSGLQSVVAGHTAAIGVLGEKVTGMEKSVTSAVERSLEAADTAMEASKSVVVLASSVEAQLASFTDMFVTSGGDVDYGVDAKKVFVKDYWKVEPEFPVLGAAMPALGAVDVSKDMITVDEAVQNLDGVDKVLAERIEAISSGVGPGLIVLSGSVVKEFGAVRGEITSLSSDAKNYTDAMYTKGIAVVSGLGVEIKGEVSSLSGNVKSYVDAVSGNTYDKSVTDALASINWFLEHTYTPWIQTSERQILLYALNSAASGDNGIRACVSAEITRATGAEDQKIAKASIIKSFDGSLDDTQVPGAKTTYDFVNSSINSFAAYYITKNAAGDAFATKAELTAAVASKEFYNGGKLRVPTKNDYCVVLADESRIDKGLTPTTRYVFDGTLWAFQYIVNSTTFTQAQVNALNSGITKDIHGTITSNISTLSGYLNGLSADCVLTKAANETRFSNIDTTIANLSSDVSGSIKVLSDDLDDLEGVVTSNYSTLNGAISNLSSNASTTDEALKTSISTLSSDASATDSALAGLVSDLSGYSKNSDLALHVAITSLSGNAKTTDIALATDVGELSGYAVGHEGRIKSFEESRYFDSVAESRIWCKGYISGLVFKADGTMDPNASKYNDRQVLTLVLGIVQKLAADDHYFESQAQANAWVKSIIPLIQLNADGTLKDTSEYTDEDVLKLVLAIVNKMATLH